MTEELSEKEQEELAELRANSVTTQEGIIAEDADNVEETGDAGEQSSGDNSGQTGENTGEVIEVTPQEFAENSEPVWKSFERNSEGYYIDPNNGNLIDPDTGFEYGADSLGEDQGQVAGVDANGDSVVDETQAEEDWP